jgi:hypothetical protein
MSELPKDYDYAVHSDFLIHWTGKDIDDKYDPRWADESHRSLPGQEVADLYLRRLKDILKCGLWMTEGEEGFQIGSDTINVPTTPKCCFTELKLSESRRHARRYGRLGIGVKRPFLFDRLGRPVAYFGYSSRQSKDQFLRACARDLTNKSLLSFFKPMNSDSKALNYDLYSESEWRIILSDELLGKSIIDPRDRTNKEANGYYNSLTPEQQKKLKYLLPLDGWFSAIIYPSLRVKNPVQWNNGLGTGIADEIKRIKLKSDHGNRVEQGNWPIEIDLDSCRQL